MNKTFNKLIISPHADDEVLGCGGILDHHCFVYYCGLDESLVKPDPEHRIPLDEIFEEIKQVSTFLGFKYEYNLETRVNYYREQELITLIEDLINKLKPEFIFLPQPGFNQDHRTVFDASFIALRQHDENHFVNKVLVYEAVHDVLWNYRDCKPNYFVEINIERKLRAYQLYKSQVRSFRSVEDLRNVAAIRGKMANCGHAEAFEILRWVE